MTANANQRRIQAADNAALHVDGYATKGPFQPAGNGEVDSKSERLGVNGSFHFDEAPIGGLDSLDVRAHVEPLFDPVDALGVEVGSHFDSRQLLSEFSGNLNDILATVAGSIGESGWIDGLKEWWNEKTEVIKDGIENLSEGWDRFWDDDDRLGTTKSNGDGDVSNNPQGADCKVNESDCNSDNDSAGSSDDSGTAITAESEGPWGRGPLGPIFFQSSADTWTRNGRDIDACSTGGASTFDADALVQQVNGTIGYEMQAGMGMTNSRFVSEVAEALTSFGQSSDSALDAAGGFQPREVAAVEIGEPPDPKLWLQMLG